MVKSGGWPVGVCSWSLRQDVPAVAEVMRATGVEHIHLAVRPALEADGDSYLSEVNEQNWTISSTMIDFPQEDYSTLESIKVTGGVMPDEQWPRNRTLFEGAADATANLGVRYLSMHAGFLDPAREEQARKFSDRIRSLADMAAEKDIMLLLETGQETAEELRHFLEDLNHTAAGVNFDPANMILYDKGHPTEALRTLGPWIKHVHIKDAVRTPTPGTWGTEVPWGDGEVGGDTFLKVLKDIGYGGALAIERESGDDRVGDIALAVERLSAFQP
jgi:L-ribulose-5-phosphate 3-epimerase